MKKPLFIAFEGIDGSGKSTQSLILADRLRQEGLNVHSTFEPSKGPVGSMIRNILKGETQMDERTIAGLFVADRLDHILNGENGLLKMLNEGNHVITDRYYFSSYAYHACHMDMEWVIQANSMSAELLRPTATFFIDVTAEECMRRILAGRKGTERYESLENLEEAWSTSCT